MSSDDPLLETAIERPAATRRPPRKRPGRLRRWVVRPLGWGLALAVIFLSVLQLLVNTRTFRDWARGQISGRIGELIERRVDLDDISLTLFPLSVEIWGFRIHGPEGIDSELPFLEVPWAAVDADLQALQQNVLRLREVRAERPKIYLHYIHEGVNNILKLHEARQRRGGSQRSGPRSFDVLIDHVSIEQAEVLIDQEMTRISVSGDDLHARFQGSGHLHIDGELAGQNVAVYLPDARPFTVSLLAKGSIQRGRIGIDHAEASGSDISATGDGACTWPVNNPLDRKCEIRIQGTTSGEKLAEIGYFRDLEGDFDFDGTFFWRPRTQGWRSTIVAPRFDLWGRQLDDVRGVLVADRFQTRMDLHQAHYGGGNLQGTIDVATREPGRPMKVDLDFEGVRADQLIADQNIPAGPIASRVSGNVVYEFLLKEGRRGDGQGEVVVEADAGLAGLPLAGSFPIRIDSGVVRAESAVLSSPKQTLFANGFFDVDARVGRFDYQVVSLDVVPIIHTLRLVEDGEPWPQWLPQRGEGRMDGTLELSAAGTSTDVHLKLDKVYGLDLVGPHQLESRFHFDERGLEDFWMRVGRHDPELASWSSLEVRGWLPFPDEADQYPSGEEALHLVFDSRYWPIDAIRPWLDFELDVDGRISGNLDLRVDDAGSYGAMRAVLSQATLVDIPFDTVAGRLNWDLERLEFDEITMRSAAGEIEGDGTMRWPSVSGGDQEALDVHLRAAALEIGEEPWRSYLPRQDLGGEVAMEARLTGSRERPRLDLQIRAGGLSIGPRVLQGRSSELQVKWADGHLDASGRLLDMMTLEGGGALEGNRGELVFDLDGHDVAGLLELLFPEPPAGVDGRFSGKLQLVTRFDGRRPEGGTSRIGLELDVLDVGFRGRRLLNLEPVTLRLDEENLEIGSLRLEERATGSELFVAGAVGYSAGAPIDLRVEGTLSNSWLRLYQPNVGVEGYFDLDGRMVGTVGEPYFDGQGRIRDARVVFEALPEFPHTLENVEGLVLFDADGIVIDHLETEMAGGQVRLEGRAGLPRRGEPLRFRLKIAGEDLRVRYPEGWLVAGDADLTLRTLEPGSSDADPLEPGFLLAGHAYLSRLEYTQNIDLGFTQIVQETLLRQRLEVDSADQLWSLVQLNLEVSGPDALRVKNNLAELSGGVGLGLRGSLSKPVVLGSIDLDPGGQLEFSSVDYTLDRGRLGFTDPVRFNPEVDLVATTRVRDFDVQLTLSGTMDRLNTGFTSRPPLPALEVFELLATGGDEELESNTVRRADEIGQEQSMSAASFLYGQAAEVIGERVSNLFGFDKFRIAPLTGSGDNLSKARVTVGKRLSKDIFLSYSADPSSTEEQRLRIEWQISRGLVLVLTQNGDNTYEADARWETSF